MKRQIDGSGSASTLKYRKMYSDQLLLFLILYLRMLVRHVIPLLRYFFFSAVKNQHENKISVAEMSKYVVLCV